MIEFFVIHRRMSVVEVALGLNTPELRLTLQRCTALAASSFSNEVKRKIELISFETVDINC